MAITISETQVEWDGDGSEDKSVAGGGSETSDTFSPNATCFQAKIELKADHSDTPESGDTVDFWLLEGLGDPDGSGATEFATEEQGQHLATLDLNENDPAVAVVWLPGPFEDCQIYAVNNDADDAVTVSATMLEHRSS